jgi:dienelactone hydrolase
LKPYPHKIRGILSFLLLTSSLTLSAQQNLPPLWERETVAEEGSFTRHLDSLTGFYQQEWETAFEKHLVEGTLEAHQESLKALFLARIGSFPEKSDLNARITGVIKRDAYRVEKVLFESRPDFYVSGLVFVPEAEVFSPPFPAVLVPCGHSETAKGYDAYQAMGALCATNGMAALVFDPLDQGERHQLLDEEGKPLMWGTHAHNMEGIRASLLGQHLAGYFTWDGIRAVDYLVSREDVDPGRIGISGNSGGGTQTTYLFAADPRIKAAAPSCFIHTIFTEARLEMGDAEQNIFAQMRDGLDHPDYIMMAAPRPHKILAATHDFFRIYATWDTYRYVKRYYSWLGYSERADIMENLEGHNYNQLQREAAVQWLLRWLAGRDEQVRETAPVLLDISEYTVTDSASVLKIPGAISVNELFSEAMEESRDSRNNYLANNSNDELRSKIRSLTGMDHLDQRGLELISMPEDHVGSATGTHYLFESANGYRFRGKHFSGSSKKGKDLVLFLSEKGSDYHLAEIRGLTEAGHEVLSLDLPGTGPKAWQRNKGLRLSSGLSWEDCNKAYLMGRSIVGYRTSDILQVAEFLSKLSLDQDGISLHASGETGIPALHAAFLEPGLFSGLTLKNCLESWEEVVASKYSFNQLVNVVHDVLNYYDLPDLEQRLGKPLKRVDPADALGRTAQGEIDPDKLSQEPLFSGLAGIYYHSPGWRNPDGPDWAPSLDMSFDQQRDARGGDWSSEWFGYLESPADGKITFLLEADQEVELIVADRVVAVTGEGKEPLAHSLRTKKGAFVPVRIRFSQDGARHSFLRLSWSWKDGEQQPVPLEKMWHSSRQRYEMEESWKHAL